MSPALYHGIFMLKSPEVVATKKYTGYLHYRFITIGSRSLWSPRCSYMWFFLALVWPCQLFVRLWYRVSDVLDLSLVSKRFGFYTQKKEIQKKGKAKRRAYQCPLPFIMKYLC
jgi:hypothetical protein